MCQYCGCDENTVIGRLMDEHVVMVNLAGDLRRAVASGDTEQVRAAGEALVDMLTQHALLEEAGLFTQMRTRADVQPTVDALLDDHDELDILAADVTAGKLAEFANLENLMRRHFDKEENSLFPAAYVELMAEDWNAIEEREHAMRHQSGVANRH